MRSVQSGRWIAEAPLEFGASKGDGVNGKGSTTHAFDISALVRECGPGWRPRATDRFRKAS